MQSQLEWLLAGKALLCSSFSNLALFLFLLYLSTGLLKLKIKTYNRGSAG